jgi:hypothetical protein
VFVPAAIAFDPQEAVIQKAALEVTLELLAHEFGQVTAGSLRQGKGAASRQRRTAAQTAQKPIREI